MPLKFSLLRTALLASAGLQLAGSALALSCDELRATVEAKIRAKGVSAFSVEIVDAGVTRAGQNVGTCERGARKLIYVQGAGATRAAVAAPPVPRPASAPRPEVITECADGRVITHGSCKR